MIEKEELLEELNKLKKVVCIVEGPKDKKALQKLGIEKVIELTKKPIYATVEEIDAKEAAILTDLDEKGKQLYHKLYKDLQRRKVKINNKLREKLFKAKISHIEGLATYLATEQQHQ